MKTRHYTNTYQRKKENKTRHQCKKSYNRDIKVDEHYSLSHTHFQTREAETQVL